ncbi:Bcr/CflA family efflux MFS transporter [bacterium]|nr:Bcr/CflA family efflux MFS transporter [bacterium]
MTDSSTCDNSKVFMFLLLGTLSAFGPFITDMFLPTLPSMSDYFHASTSMVQLSLTFSMLGLALGQLVFGPLSGKFGRRPPLIYSMLIFIFSTIGCILSPVIEIFLFFRFLQGIAGAGGVVISRSVAVDKFSTEELTAALSIIGGINGIAPVVAPIIGGFCTDSIGWRGIFLILLILGCLILFMCLNFRESLTEDKRAQDNLWNVFKLFKEVLDNKIYLFYVLQMALSQGILFGNIASSPFIIQEYYQQNALMFSLYFSINSVAIGIGAASSIKFKNPNNGMFVSCIGMLVGS